MFHIQTFVDKSLFALKIDKLILAAIRNLVKSVPIFAVKQNIHHPMFIIFLQ
jgi:hypothetical protein